MRWTCGLIGALAACGRVNFDSLDGAQGLDGRSFDGAGSDGTQGSSACDSNNLDLVACFEFESNGNDSSSYHNDLTVLAGISFPPAHTGRGIKVDTGSIVTTPHHASLDLTTAFTIDAWVNLSQLPPAGTRSVIVDNEGAYLFGFTATGMECSAVLHVDIAVQVPLSTWTHVACTYDNAAMTLYVDGAPVGSMPESGATAIGTMGLQIGANTPDVMSPNPDNLIGVIDQLRIWRVVLPCAVDASC